MEHRMWGIYCLVMYFIVHYGDCKDKSSLWCYQCGTEVQNTPSCQDFRKASTWIPFKRDCGEDSVCVKTVNFHNQEMRGCTPAVTISGARHRQGCWSHPESGYVFCFCADSYCNSSPKDGIFLGLLVAVMLRLFL